MNIVVCTISNFTEKINVENNFSLRRFEFVNFSGLLIEIKKFILEKMT